MSKLSTFPNEEVVLRLAPDGGLAMADMVGGRQYVAVTADGYRTDYPIMHDDGRVYWDNPEWFPKSFREKVQRAMAKRRVQKNPGIEIQPGDLVTIMSPQGQYHTGRVVMKSSHPDSWVLNMGGKHGTPGIATVGKNIVRVRKGRGRGFNRIQKNPGQFRRGEIVKYARPGKGEEDIRFHVLEDHSDASPPRVRIQSVEPMTKGSRFHPIEVVAPEELVAVRENPDSEVPQIAPHKKFVQRPDAPYKGSYTQKMVRHRKKHPLKGLGDKDVVKNPGESVKVWICRDGEVLKLPAGKAWHDAFPEYVKPWVSRNHTPASKVLMSQINQGLDTYRGMILNERIYVHVDNLGHPPDAKILRRLRKYAESNGLSRGIVVERV